MRAWLRSLPFLLILMGVGAASMAVPVIHAYQLRDLEVARDFLYAGLLFGVFFVMLALAAGTRGGVSRTRGQLLALVVALVLLPLMLAVPFREALPGESLGRAWFEMVSALTTTGATLYGEPGDLPLTLHLWRAIVAWLGGLLFWVSALAILAPLNLGGFEVIATDTTAAGRAALRQRRAGQAGERLRRYAGRLAPVYAGLTLLLWLLLSISGMAPTESAILAMSTLATSGITPGPWQSPGILAEVFMFLFLILAISRLTFRNDYVTRERGAILRDPEMRLGLAICMAVPLVLVLRHWLGALEGAEQQGNLSAGLVAFWGGLFTTLSFLTTHGVESLAFAEAQAWSGLDTPGLILVGLSLVGGGVATTAGGVKLLRIYALYKHGTREMARLVYPQSVGGSGAAGRRLRREGAFVAWIFFMLFAISVAVCMAALTLAGQGFQSAMILSVAALSTTGPLAAVGETPVAYAQLGAAAQGILAVVMVVGRLETLALIALLSRDFWR